MLAFGLWLVPRTIIPHARVLLRPEPGAGLAGRVEQLTRARADAVDSAAAELRRVERDLHDGAQARLVALGMSLRAAERLIQASPQAAAALVAEAREASAKALTELRNLVRGIYPPVLADRGLGEAVRALASTRRCAPRPTSSCPDGPTRRSSPRATSRSPRRSPTRSSTPAPARPRSGSGTPAACSGSRSPTTAAAAPTRPAAAAWPGSSGGWAHSMAPGPEQPARRPDHDRHGGTVPAVPANGPLLLSDGLARPPRMTMASM